MTLLWGCNGQRDDLNGKILARVGDEQLTIENAVSQIPEFVLAEDSLEALKSFSENWVRKQLLLQEAERLQLSRRTEVRNKLKKAEEEILIQSLKDIVLSDYSKGLSVSDEEVRNYYQAHKDQFILNERYVRFRHVETEDLEAARAARRALSRGIPWQEVARRYCINPETKIRKSEQFWPISIALSDLQIMNQYLRRIGHTERSVIRRIGSTYHFVQLMESRSQGEHPDLEWLMKQIKEWLLLDKKRRHFSSYVKNLYLKANSNNEIDTYNVFTNNSNDKTSSSDTVETN